MVVAKVKHKTPAQSGFVGRGQGLEEVNGPKGPALENDEVRWGQPCVIKGHPLNS